MTDLRVTQTEADVGVQDAGKVEVTQAGLDIVTTIPPPDARVTQQGVDIVITKDNLAQVTQLGLDIVIRPALECIPTTGRIITSPLNDVTLRPQYLGHKTIVEVTEDPYGTAEASLTWTTVHSGYTTRATLQDALTWEFEIGDTDRVEQRSVLFAGPDLVVGQPSCLLGGPIVGGFDSIPDTGLPIFEVTDHFGTDPYVTLAYKTGPLPLLLDLGSFSGPLADFLQSGYNQLYLNGIAQPFGVRSPEYESFQRGFLFPQIVVTLYNVSTGAQYTGAAGAVRGVTGEFTPISTRQQLRSRSFRSTRTFLNDRLFGSGLEFAIDWDTDQPTPGDRYLVLMQVATATELCPFHFDGHPVDLATAIYDALGIVYDAASATTTKLALGLAHRVRLRPRRPEKAITVLEDWLQGPHGFAYRVVDGVRILYASRFRDSGTPSATIDITDLRGVGTPYELPARSTITRLVWQEQVFEPWEFTTDSPVDQRPLDGLLPFERPTTYDQDDSNALPFGSDHTYSYPGFIPDPARKLTPPSLRGVSFKQAVAEEIFFRWGRGAGEVVFPCLPAFTSQIGEYVVNTVDYSPIPEPGPFPITVRPKDYPTRDPRQILQVVKRSESPAGPEIRFLVVGPVSADLTALTVPTLSIAASTAFPKNAATVTVTNFATIALDPDNRIELQWAISPTSPTSWATFGVLLPTGTGVVDTPLADAGSRVWVRARTTNVDGRVGAFSSTVDVDLTDLVAPSGLASTPIDDTSFTLTWTNGETTIPIALEVKEAAASQWIRWATLPPGTTSFTLLLPDVNTTYDVRVFHEELAPLRGVSATNSIQVITGTTPTALTAPTNPEITSGSGIAQLCVNAAASFADFVFEFKKELDTDFVALVRNSGLPVGGQSCASISVPQGSGSWHIRVRHEQLGFTPSSWVQVLVDPWTDAVPRVGRDFFSVTDPATDPSNNVQAGDYWLRTDNLTTPAWFERYRRNEANTAWMLLWAWAEPPDNWSLGDIPYVDSDGRIAMVPGIEEGVFTIDGGVPSFKGAGAIDGDVLTWDDVAGEWIAAPQTGGAHASTHEDGGADEIDVTGLSGLLADPQKIEIAKAGTLVGTRKRVNLIEGSNVTLTVADDAGGNEVDVTIASSGGGSGPAWGPVYTPPPTTGWTGVNVGTSSLTPELDSLLFLPQSGGTIRLYERTLATATPYTLTVGLLGSARHVNFTGFGIGLTQPATDAKLVVFHLLSDTGLLHRPMFYIQKFTDPSTFSASYTLNHGAVNYIPLRPSDVLWLRIEDDGTDRIFSYSPDGRHFLELERHSRTDHITPTHAGFHFREAQVENMVRVVSWKEE